jgi:hypothetical protein
MNAGLFRVAVLCTSVMAASGMASAQSEPPDAPTPQTPQTSESQPTSPPQNPGEDKNQGNENPAENAAEKTVHLTVQAAEISKKVGEAALVKARNRRWPRRAHT